MELYQTFYSLEEKRENIFMNNIEELFDKEMVENISNLVEDKMKLLKEIKDFREKDEKLSNCIEEMENLLSEDLKEKFNTIMKLTYQVEDYYFTLAYLLGSKYTEKTKGL